MTAVHIIQNATSMSKFLQTLINHIGFCVKGRECNIGGMSVGIVKRLGGIVISSKDMKGECNLLILNCYGNKEKTKRKSEI